MKLTDLGLATRLDARGLCKGTSGTIGYKAFEIDHGSHEHGVPADLFALAVTAFELFCGK